MVSSSDFAQRLEKPSLDVDVLENGLDHDVDVGKVFEVTRDLDPA